MRGNLGRSRALLRIRARLAGTLLVLSLSFLDTRGAHADRGLATRALMVPRRGTQLVRESEAALPRTTDRVGAGVELRFPDQGMPSAAALPKWRKAGRMDVDGAVRGGATAVPLRYAQGAGGSRSPTSDPNHAGRVRGRYEWVERSLDPHDVEGFRRLFDQFAARDWSDPLRRRFEANRRDLAVGKDLTTTALRVLRSALLLNPDGSPGFHLMTEDGYLVQRIDTADASFLVVGGPDGFEEVVRAEDSVKNLEDRICKYEQLIGVADEVLAGGMPSDNHHRSIIHDISWISECPPIS